MNFFAQSGPISITDFGHLGGIDHRHFTKATPPSMDKGCDSTLRLAPFARQRGGVQT